jgi:hypothetical protein
VRYNSAFNLFETLGAGTSAEVKGLDILDDNVYLVGSFSTAGGNPALGIAKYNIPGSSYTALGNGVPNGSNTVVALSTNNVIVGGSFSFLPVSLTPALNVTRWNGSDWNTVGSGLSDQVNKLIKTSTGTVYASSTSQASGNTPITYVAKLVDNAWEPVLFLRNQGQTSTIGITDEDVLYIPLERFFVNAIAKNGIASFDESKIVQINGSFRVNGQTRNVLKLVRRDDTVVLTGTPSSSSWTVSGGQSYLAANE